MRRRNPLFGSKRPTFLCKNLTRRSPHYNSLVLGLENFRGFVQGFTAFGDAEIDRRYQPYVQWLASGGRAMGYTYDPSIVWAKICRVIADEYGPAAIEKSLRALRDDGLPSSLYRTADTALKKNTLLFCVMSCAAGTNLLARFDAWGFDADQAYFSTIFSAVNQILSAWQETV